MSRHIKRRVAALALAGLFAAQAATAASFFDFQAIADGATFESTLGTRTGEEGNWNVADSAGNGPVVGAGAGIVVNGITVYAVGSHSGGTPADAFLDSKMAGLGVCSSLPVGCKSGVPGADTADDNLNRAEEALELTFDRTVRVTGLSIQNAEHKPANGDFTVGGVTYSVLDGVVDPDALELITPAAVYRLGYLATGPELYIRNMTVEVSDVPLPAALWLLAVGLGGLGLTARRRRG